MVNTFDIKNSNIFMPFLTLLKVCFRIGCLFFVW